MSLYSTTISEANQYIASFIDEYPGVASNNALGGNMELSSLQGALNPDKVGSLAWFCFNDHHADSGLPSFFLAFEAVASYSKSEGPSEPENNTLILPGNTFPYEDDHGHEQDYLNHHQSDVSGLSDGSIDKEDVETYNASFVSNFADNTNYPYSFFDTADDDDLKDFLNQDGIVFMGYFFGYSDDPDYGDNKIRVIFAPLDEDGFVITTGNPVLLQRSYPPPPPLD